MFFIFFQIQEAPVQIPDVTTEADDKKQRKGKKQTNEPTEKVDQMEVRVFQITYVTELLIL